MRSYWLIQWPFSDIMLVVTTGWACNDVAKCTASAVITVVLGMLKWCTKLPIVWNLFVVQNSSVLLLKNHWKGHKMYCFLTIQLWVTVVLVCNILHMLITYLITYLILIELFWNYIPYPHFEIPLIDILRTFSHQLYLSIYFLIFS